LRRQRLDRKTVTEGCELRPSSALRALCARAGGCEVAAEQEEARQRVVGMHRSLAEQGKHGNFPDSNLDGHIAYKNYIILAISRQLFFWRTG
jgi:hypothetical protein